MNQRTKKLYVQEVLNLTLAFPYLAPFLDKHIFDNFSYEGIETSITDFVHKFIRLGIKKLYPDAIAYGLYFALKNGIILELRADEYDEIVGFDDCLVTVLLLEYALKQNLREVRASIIKLSDALKSAEERARDRQWLLIYQIWTEAELRGNQQQFLANLKKLQFQFLSFSPKVKPNSPNNYGDQS